MSGSHLSWVSLINLEADHCKNLYLLLKPLKASINERIYCAIMHFIGGIQHAISTSHFSCLSRVSHVHVKTVTNQAGDSLLMQKQLVPVYDKNQTSERPVRSESLKLWRTHYKSKNYCYLFFDLQLTGLIQNKNKIQQYQSILQDPRCILIQIVELFSARMYG